LRYFVAVAEEGTFTAAARRLHVAQPALSSQVRQLEEIVGAQLLERTSRGATLTAAGVAFLDGAHVVLSTLDRSAAAARNIAGAVSGRLAIGLRVGAVGVEGGLPARIVKGFEHANPQVEICIQTFDVTCPAAGLLDRTSDVAFVSPPVEAPGISLRTIAMEPRVFVLPAGHCLAEREQISLTDVSGLRWIAADEASDGCHPTAWRDAWLISPRPGGEHIPIGGIGRTIDDFREQVIAGRGIMLCPASAQAYHSRPELVFVTADGVPPAEVCLAWRTGDSNPIVAAFLDAVNGAATGAAE
jgi:DNA-binding transcriptional LysR family regulator